MNLQRILVPLAIAATVALAFRSYGWAGVALVAGGLVMWLLLHVTRLMTVMQRAARRPMGHVDSAVMLNAKLKPGMTLMHVTAMTRSLGQRSSPAGVEPEHYQWTDAGESVVTAEFHLGKLVSWTLARPAPDDAAVAADGRNTAP